MTDHDRGPDVLRALAGLVLVCAGIALGGAAKQAEGTPALSCYERALESTLLNTNDVVALCTGARGTGPLDCFLEAEETTILSQQDTVVLCRCAEDLAPVRCYEEAQRTATLTQQQIVALCAPSVQGTLYPSCEPAGFQRPEVDEDQP
jgi:hypothetical protein